MGGRISNQQLKEYREADPSIKQYLDCQSKAFMKGLQACVVGAGTVFIGCYVINKRIPLNPATMLLVPIGGGVGMAYIVARIETKKCQKMWLALEEKHTALSEMVQPLE